MKWRNRNNSRGSVSIFLTIILVPMIAISGLLVDASRVQLAKGMVVSSGDLTLNAALANYDTILKDVYGLFAMSQNDADLTSNLKQYFTDTLIANGIVNSAAEIDANPLLTDIRSAFIGSSGSSGLSDLMSMEVDEFIADPVENSDLSQSYILKNQIVEFMKYRTPINIGMSFLDGIAAFKKVSKQAEVTEKKVEVDEKAEDFTNATQKLYCKLATYQGNIQTDGTSTTEAKAKCFETKVPNGVNPYQESIYKSQYDWYKAAYEEIHRSLVVLMPEIPEAQSLSIPDGDAGSLQSAVSSLISAYKSGNPGAKLKSMRTVSNPSLAQRVQYLVLFAQYKPQVEQIQQTYARYLSQFNELEDEQKEALESAHSELMSQYNDVQEEYSDLEALNTINKNIVKAEQDRVNDSIAKVHKDINARIDWAKESLNLLEAAIDQLKKVKAAAEVVNAANSQFNDSIQRYNQANGAQSDSFSEGMNDEYRYNTQSFDISEVQELSDLLDAHHRYITAIQSALEGMKYADKPIKDLNSFKSTAKALGDKGSSNGQTYRVRIETQFAVDPLAITDSYANGLFAEGLFTKPPYPETGPTSNLNALQRSRFWNYLYRAFSAGESEDQKDELNKKDKEGIVDLAKSESSEAQSDEEGKDGFNGGTIEGITGLSKEAMGLPSSDSDADGKDVEVAASTLDLKGTSGNTGFSSMLKNMGGTVSKLLGGLEKALADGRDHLYITDYAFNMFSYYTQNAEYPKEHPDDSTRTPKTVTGFEINASNNVLYRGEIEYLVYGNSDMGTNVNMAKGSIFAIRFVVNAGYALTNAEINAYTLPPALSIQALSGGLIPYKLPQVVMQLALALAESAIDLNTMLKGDKVAILKSPATWALSPSGAAAYLKDKSKEAIENFTNVATNKVKGTMNNLIDNLSNQVEVKTADVINDITAAANAKLNELIGAMFNQFSNTIATSLDQVLLSGKEEAINAAEAAEAMIDNALDEAHKKITILASNDGIVREILEEFYINYLVKLGNSMKAEIEDVIHQIDEISVSKQISNLQEKIAKQINDTLSSMSITVETKAKSMISELSKKIESHGEDVIDKASKQAKEAIVTEVDAFFDQHFPEPNQKTTKTMGGKSKNSALSSILKFGYSDYLKMFMFLRLSAGDEKPIRRIADVIQLNVGNDIVGNGVNYSHAQGTAFRMANANTYVGIDATVRLKTMFMSLPYLTERSGESVDYFVVKYKSVLGY